jgi:hypothetical protein
MIQRHSNAAVGIAIGLGLLALVTSSLRAAQSAGTGAYRLVEGWPEAPPGHTFGTLSGVMVDRKGVIYVFERNELGDVWMFDKSGKYLGKWAPSGKPGFVKMAHTMHMDPQGNFWVTDRTGHQIKKFTPEGKLLLTLGKYDTPGNGPDTFNGPTGMQFLPNGDFIVSDGYWNNRVSRFNKDGKFISQVGSTQRPAKSMEGRGPGHFGLVHAGALSPNGRYLVSDRCDGPVGPDDETRRNPKCNDSRVQVVEANGTFVEFWNQLRGPLSLLVVGQKLYTQDGNKLLILDANTGKEIDSIVANGQVHQIAVDATEDNIYATFLGNAGGQRTGGRGAVRRFTREPAR